MDGPSPAGLVLASASPRRRSLMREAGYRFRVVPAGVSEACRARDPRRLVLVVALRKARAVARRLRGRASRRPEDALVLAADTIVVCRGEVLQKPRNAADNLRMLSKLNGTWHRVLTGVAVVDAASGRSWSEAAVSRVKARRLAADALRGLAGRHLDKAGGYAAQDRRDPFIERVAGAFDNVVGLPMACVRRLLALAEAGGRRGLPPASAGL